MSEVPTEALDALNEAFQRSIRLAYEEGFSQGQDSMVLVGEEVAAALTGHDVRFGAHAVVEALKEVADA